VKNNTTFLLLLFFLTQLALGQQGDKQLQGRIVADSTSVEKVNIINTRNEKAVMTDKDGNFKIGVWIGDVLVISAVNLETRRKAITQEDVQQEVLLIKVNPKMTQLNEVNVNENSEINSENLGITPHGQKEYTPAERKVRTATTGLIDPLINKLSGRTEMLKKGVVVERNERLLLKFDGLYEENYYTEVLKIPKDHIKGFQYYLIEDPDYVRALQAKNKTMTMFLIKRLALNYNEILLKEQQVGTD
jgi:hypothetical protein